MLKRNKITDIEKNKKIENRYGSFISLLNDSKLKYFIFDDNINSEDCVFVINNQENCFDDKILEKEFDDKKYSKRDYNIVFKSKQKFDEINYPNLIITKFKEDEIEKLSDISEVYDKIINKHYYKFISCIFNNVKIKNLNLEKISHECNFEILFLGENEIENITIDNKKIKNLSLYLNNTIKNFKTLKDINEYEDDFFCVGRSQSTIFLEFDFKLKELVNFKSDITIYSYNSQLKRVINTHINKLIINNQDNEEWYNLKTKEKNNRFKEIINSNINYVDINDSKFKTIKNSKIEHFKMLSRSNFNYSKQDIFDKNMQLKIKNIEDKYNLITIIYKFFHYGIVNNSNVFWIVSDEFRYDEHIKPIFDEFMPDKIKEDFVKIRYETQLMVDMIQNKLKATTIIDPNEFNKLDKYGCDVMDYCFNVDNFNVLLKNGYNNFTKEKCKIINNKIKNLYEKELLKKNGFELIVPIEDYNKKIKYKIKKNNIV